MATRSALKLNEEVLITYLASNSTRGIHPALGCIIGFLDPDRKSQAILKYRNGQVNRPISKLVHIVKANETIPAKGICFCPLAEVDGQVQEEQENQEEGTPGPDELDGAASLQDEYKQHPHVLPSLPEEPLPQTVKELPLDRMEEVAPPPVEVAETTSRRPATGSRGGHDQALLGISGTVPAQGMRNTHTDRPQRPKRIRKNLLKFPN